MHVVIVFFLGFLVKYGTYLPANVALPADEIARAKGLKLELENKLLEKLAVHSVKERHLFQDTNMHKTSNFHAEFLRQ